VSAPPDAGQVSGRRSTPPGKVDRDRLPVPGPTRNFPFPGIEKSTLPNGLRVWTVRHTQVPLVAFTLLIRRGASSDPAGKEGLAAVTADMLDEGSGDRSAIEIHEALARLGAQFDTDIGSDATVTSVTVLSRFTSRALELLSDVVVRPAIRDADFLRVRSCGCTVSPSFATCPARLPIAPFCGCYTARSRTGIRRSAPRRRWRRWMSPMRARSTRRPSARTCPP